MLRYVDVWFRRIGVVAVAAVALSTNADFAHATLILESWSAKACANVRRFSELEACGGIDAAIDTRDQIAPGIAVASQSLGNSRASAFQSPGGFDSAGVSVASDLGFDSSALGNAIFTFKVANLGAVPVPLQFRFLIFDGRLEIDMKNFVALHEDRPFAEVRAAFEEIVSGFGSAKYVYQGTLAGSNSSSFPGFTTLLLDPQGIGKPSATVAQHLASGDASAAVDLDSFSGVLDLGVIDPGTLREFQYSLRARVYTGQHDSSVFAFPDPAEVTGVAEIKDPFSLDSGFYLNDVSFADLIRVASPVGEPAGLALIGLGLAGLAAIRRKRS